MGVMTTVLEALGFVLLVVAGWLVAPALGLTVAGLGLLAAGWLLGDEVEGSDE